MIRIRQIGVAVAERRVPFSEVVASMHLFEDSAICVFLPGGGGLLPIYGFVEQRQHRRPDRAGQGIEPVHGVQAADIADGALTGSLLDGVAQAPELVGFAEHPAPVTFLLIGFVRAQV